MTNGEANAIFTIARALGVPGRYDTADDVPSATEVRDSLAMLCDRAYNFMSAGITGDMVRAVTLDASFSAPADDDDEKVDGYEVRRAAERIVGEDLVPRYELVRLVRLYGDGEEAA